MKFDIRVFYKIRR